LPFATFHVGNVTITGDKTLILVLQFVHDPPVTTATLSPPPDGTGKYSDPVTITLAATAFPGFTISATYYTIDSGPTLSYTGPFKVTGGGPHTVRFWSVDSAGVYEAPRTISFTVVSDRTAPVTTATPSLAPNAAGWYNQFITVRLDAVDETGGSGVKWIEFALNGGEVQKAVSSTTVVPISADGVTTLAYWATDNAGNVEARKTLTIRIDRTVPVVSGLPPADCTLWPPDHKMVQVATVTATGGISGLAFFSVTGTSSEPENGLGDGDMAPDIVITGAGLGPYTVQLRAERAGMGPRRVYTLAATVTTVAGTSTTKSATCTVPRDQGKK